MQTGKSIPGGGNTKREKPGVRMSCCIVGTDKWQVKEGIYVYVWLIHFVVQQKLTQHCKATIPQLKKKGRWDRSALSVILVTLGTGPCSSARPSRPPHSGPCWTPPPWPPGRLPGALGPSHTDVGSSPRARALSYRWAFG